jgi:hypothetical protein
MLAWRKFPCFLELRRNNIKYLNADAYLLLSVDTFYSSFLFAFVSFYLLVVGKGRAVSLFDCQLMQPA